MIQTIISNGKHVVLDIDKMKIYATRDISRMVVLNPLCDTLSKEECIQVGNALKPLIETGYCDLDHVPNFLSNVVDCWSDMPIRADIISYNKSLELVKLTIQGIKNVVNYRQHYPKSDMHIYK